MPEPTTCNQRGCNQPASFRFTWPGNDEAGICLQHSEQLSAISAAMGFHVQLIPLSKEVAALVSIANGDPPPA